jgi:hypothetical protein
MLLELVELQVDLPEYNLERGRIGAVIDESDDWFVVEFRNINEYIYQSVKLHQDQILKTEKSPTEEGLSLLGIRHFLHQDEQEWALLAVKAPIDEVTRAFAEFRGVEEWAEDIPKICLDVDNPNRYEDFAAFIEVIYNNWTVILRSLSDYLGNQVNKEAKFLSEKLKTQAIYCLEEDTSMAMAYRLYDCGKEIEYLEVEEGDVVSIPNKSKRFTKKFCDELMEIEARKDDEDDPIYFSALHEIFDCLFRDLGIYVPACFPTDDLDFLEVYGVSTGTIGKVNLMAVEDVY